MRSRAGTRGRSSARGLRTLLPAVAGAIVLTAATRPVERPVWPPPPDRARIEFVETWSGPRDFAKDFWKRLSNFAGGKGSKDAFVKPTGIAVSPDGQRVYVVDAVRRAICTFDRAARRATSRSLDDVVRGPTAPFGLALDGDENLYVTDQAGRGVIVVSREGRLLRAIGRDTLARPVGCAVDPARGLLYVADVPQGREAPHRVAAFALDGRFIRWIGARGLEPGKFNYPTYLTVSPDGELLVVDTLNWRVQVFSADGRFVRAFGRHSDARGDFDRPKGIALDRFGNAYVADGSWDRVLIFSRHGRPLLDFGGRGTWPGGLQEPTAVAIGGDDRIYVADTNGHRVNVYRLINTTAADSVAGAGGSE